MTTEGATGTAQHDSCYNIEAALTLWPSSVAFSRRQAHLLETLMNLRLFSSQLPRSHHLPPPEIIAPFMFCWPHTVRRLDDGIPNEHDPPWPFVSVMCVKLSFILNKETDADVFILTKRLSSDALQTESRNASEHAKISNLQSVIKFMTLLLTPSSLSVENHTKGILSLHEGVATRGALVSISTYRVAQTRGGPFRRRSRYALRDFTRLKTDDLLFFFPCVPRVTLRCISQQLSNMLFPIRLPLLGEHSSF